MDNKDISLEANYKYKDKIGWFASTKELCNLIYDLKDNKSFYINPGLARKSDWTQIAYKGGSQPGVLQYTHLLKHERGKWICISSSINDNKNIDDEFQDIVVRIINLVHSEL